MIRLVFEELGIDYEDRRIRTPEEWTKLKPQVPFGQLPIYEDGDFFLAQSHAIIRHLARTHDLYGKGEEEYARCDMVEETAYEAQETLWRFFWEPDFEAKKESFAENRLLPGLTELARLLKESGSAYFVGNELTYVDLYAFVFLDQIRALFGQSLESFPLLKDFRARIANRPRIARYLASDRRPTGFGIGIRGVIRDPEAVGPTATTPLDHLFPA